MCTPNDKVVINTKEMPPMKKLIIYCFAHMFLAIFLTSDLFATEKAETQSKKVTPKKVERSMIQTFLGKIAALDPAKKTMTVKTNMEGEFYFHEKDTLLKEFVVDEVDITFNTAEATIVGNKIIKLGDTVRVGYNKEGNTYIAHTILKIEKKGRL
jgi:hypothetical protein